MATDPWVKKETTSYRSDKALSYSKPKSRDFFSKINDEQKRLAPIRMAEEAESEKKIRMLAENPGREDAASMFASLSTKKQDRLGFMGLGTTGSGRRSGGGGGGTSGGGQDDGILGVDKFAGVMDRVNAEARTRLETGYLPPGLGVGTDGNPIDTAGNPLDQSMLFDRIQDQVAQEYGAKVNAVMDTAKTVQTANDFLTTAAEGRKLGLGMSEITETRMDPGTTDIRGRTADQVPNVKGGLFRKFSDEAGRNFWSPGASTQAQSPQPTAQDVGEGLDMFYGYDKNGQQPTETQPASPAITGEKQPDRFAAAPIPERTTDKPLSGKKSDSTKTMWDLDYFAGQFQDVPSLNPKAADVLDTVTPLDFIPGVGKISNKYNPATKMAKLVPNAIIAVAEKLVNTITGPTRKITNDSVTSDLNVLNDIVRKGKGVDTPQGKRMASAIESLMKESNLSKNQAANILAERLVDKRNKGRKGIKIGRL